MKTRHYSCAALCAALALAANGCVRYQHRSALGDVTTFQAFAVKGDASKVFSKTSTIDAYGTNYHREVGIGSIKGETELEKMSGIFEAVARGLATGANPVKPVK